MNSIYQFLNLIYQSDAFPNVVGAIWMIAVAWATILTVLSKKLSILEKVVVCFAIVFSFYLAAFVDDEHKMRIIPFSDPEYALINLMDDKI